MKIEKILDKILYTIYALTFALNICAVIQTKNMAYLGTCVWVINAGTMFSLYRFESKFADRRIKWRDETIDKLFKFINEILKQLDEMAENAKREEK